VSLVVMAALGDCSGGAENAVKAPASAPADGHAPEFTGPYAAEFAQAYKDTDSDFAHRVLADSAITDAEHAEMVEVFTTCLAGKGITFQGYNSDGGFTTSTAPNPKDTHTLVDDCSRSSGEDAVGSMYDIMRTNPQNLDPATIGAACLVRAGVVPPGYDAKDFTQDNEGRFAEFGTLPADLQEALKTCSADPLGLNEH
jgi:hypothetical protein